MGMGRRCRKASVHGNEINSRHTFVLELRVAHTNIVRIIGKQDVKQTPSGLYSKELLEKVGKNLLSILLTDVIDLSLRSFPVDVLYL